jgi:DNA-binding NtrC family response regulator
MPQSVAGELLGMVGHSAPIRQVFEQIRLVAPSRSTVLIVSESGTDRQCAARALDQLSPRKEGSFVAAPANRTGEA